MPCTGAAGYAGIVSVRPFGQRRPRSRVHEFGRAAAAVVVAPNWTHTLRPSSIRARVCLLGDPQTPRVYGDPTSVGPLGRAFDVSGVLRGLGGRMW